MWLCRHSARHTVRAPQMAAGPDRVVWGNYVWVWKGSPICSGPNAQFCSRKGWELEV